MSATEQSRLYGIEYEQMVERKPLHVGPSVIPYPCSSGAMIVVDAERVDTSRKPITRI